MKYGLIVLWLIHTDASHSREQFAQSPPLHTDAIKLRSANATLVINIASWMCIFKVFDQLFINIATFRRWLCLLAYLQPASHLNRRKLRSTVLEMLLLVHILTTVD